MINNALTTMSRFNVHAVIGGKPITLQNKKPILHAKAEQLAERLTKGELKAQRVLITRA